MNRKDIRKSMIRSARCRANCHKSRQSVPTKNATEYPTSPKAQSRSDKEKLMTLPKKIPLFFKVLQASSSSTLNKTSRWSEDSLRGAEAKNVELLQTFRSSPFSREAAASSSGTLSGKGTKLHERRRVKAGLQPKTSVPSTRSHKLNTGRVVKSCIP